jgi:hypothetical protein
MRKAQWGRPEIEAAEIVAGADVPFERVTPSTHVRSTLVAASVTTLRERGLLDSYKAALPQRHHEVVLTSIAGVWLPVEVALAHYGACDTLGFSASGAVQMGRDVAGRIQGSVLGTVVRAARGMGADPWITLNQIPRLWARVFQGGDVIIRRMGPKDAVVEVRACPVAAVPYFRHACRGITLGACELVARTVYAHDIPAIGSSTRIGISVSWA